MNDHDDPFPQTERGGAPSGMGPDADLEGRILDDRYQVLRKLDAGGQGEIYLAHQVRVDREVAVKIIRDNADAATARFRTEAQIVSKLRHPNTLKLFDYGVTEDGVFYMVTELLHGESLWEIVRRGRLDVFRTLEILKQVCLSLEEAHDAGIIHRDLKPANIFVERVGEQEVIKVLDFGIAKIAGPSSVELSRVVETAVGALMGTPAYLSPEQINGIAAGPRSDLYSLGVVAFHCLAGRAPFKGSVGRLMIAHLNDQPPSFSELGVSVDPAVQSLLDRLLAKTPDARPSSARALITEIDALVEALLSPTASRTPSAAAPATSSEDTLPTPEPTSAVDTAPVDESPPSDHASPVTGPRPLSRPGIPRWVLMASVASAVTAGLAAYAVRTSTSSVEKTALPPPGYVPMESFAAPFASLSSGNTAEAVHLLEAAPPTPETLLNLAVARASLGRCREALDALDRVPARVASGPPVVRIEADCYGEIIVNAGAATVFVDDVPLAGKRLQVRPGLHTLRAERRGFQTLSKTILVSAKEEHSVDVELTRKRASKNRTISLRGYTVHEGGYAKSVVKKTLGFMSDLLIDCHRRTQQGVDAGRSLEVRFLRKREGTTITVAPSDPKSQLYLKCIEREARLFVWPPHDGNRAVVSVRVGRR